MIGDWPFDTSASYNGSGNGLLTRAPFQNDCLDLICGHSVSEIV